MNCGLEGGSIPCFQYFRASSCFMWLLLFNYTRWL